VATPETPDLETERLILRGPTAADLSPWAATIWGDADVMRYMPRSPDPPEVRAQKALSFFDVVRSQGKVGAWMIVDRASGRFMGHSMLAYREKFGAPELGYALGKAFWRRGFASEAARAVVRYGFQRADVTRMFAVAFPENEPSWRILRQLGFTYEKDVVHYDLPLAYYGLTRDRFRVG
jgi:ribosomal-protein-alanine N-acetyltransferase